MTAPKPNGISFFRIWGLTGEHLSYNMECSSSSSLTPPRGLMLDEVQLLASMTCRQDVEDLIRLLTIAKHCFIK